MAPTSHPPRFHLRRSSQRPPPPPPSLAFPRLWPRPRGRCSATESALATPPASAAAPAGPTSAQRRRCTGCPRLRCQAAAARHCETMGTLRGAASASPPLRAAPSPRREWDFTASGKVNTKREAAQPLGGARPARDRSRAAISVAAHALAPARAYASLPLPSGGVRSTRLQSLISSNRELLLSLQRRGTVTALPVAQTRSANEEPVEEEELPWWGQEESPEAEPPVAVLRGSRRSSSAQAHPGRLSSAAALKLHGACEVRVRAARESGGEAS